MLHYPLRPAGEPALHVCLTLTISRLLSAALTPENQVSAALNMVTTVDPLNKTLSVTRALPQGADGAWFYGQLVKVSSVSSRHTALL